MRSLVLSIILILGFANMQAQELNCKIQINSDLVQGTNKSVFNTLQKAMNEFVNNRKWTQMTYSSIEKIECNINVVIKKVEADLFTAELLIQSRRPVYNSNYNSPVINFKDNDFTFTYKEFDQLEWNENTITSNLTAVLAYYSYLIIGYDLDTYSRYGGTPCFQAAEAIVNAAQGSDLGKGWKAFESNKNRYAIVNNLLDEAFRKFRSYQYEYHRMGLDEMTLNITNARAKIFEGLPMLREANRARPSQIIVSTFLDAKNDELINIFTKGSPEEKKEAAQILMDINPTLSNRYEKILQ